MGKHATRRWAYQWVADAITWSIRTNGEPVVPGVADEVEQIRDALLRAAIVVDGPGVEEHVSGNGAAKATLVPLMSQVLPTLAEQRAPQEFKHHCELCNRTFGPYLSWQSAQSAGYAHRQTAHAPRDTVREYENGEAPAALPDFDSDDHNGRPAK